LRRRGRDELVEELRDRVRSLERRLDEGEDSRRRADAIIKQLTQANTALTDRLRELDKSTRTPTPSRTNSEYLENDTEADGSERASSGKKVRTTGVPSIGEVGTPRRTMFTTLVPLPGIYRPIWNVVRENEYVGEQRQVVPPGDVRNAGGISLKLRLGIIVAGTALCAAATIFDLLYAPEIVLGGVNAIFSLRLIATVAFGVYVGMKVTDRNDTTLRYQVSWVQLHVIGFLTGTVVTLLIIYLPRFFDLPCLGDCTPFYEPSLNTGYIVRMLIKYLFGTWLLFISGVVLGRVVQFKAEQERWGIPDEALSGVGQSSVAEGNTRNAAILGLVGVIGGALLQSIGQIVAAIVGK